MSMKLHLGPELAMPLDAATRATAILAVRGSGKSYCAAVLVEERPLPQRLGGAGRRRRSRGRRALPRIGGAVRARFCSLLQGWAVRLLDRLSHWYRPRRPIERAESNAGGFGMGRF